MAGQALRRLAAFVIIVAQFGCDNVEWGGTEFALRPPPPKAPPVVEDSTAADPDAPPAPPLPAGPVLYAGTRTGDRVSLTPVAELRGDTLRPLLDEADNPGFAEHFRAQRMAPGSEFVLFADGGRVGTLVADTSSLAGGPCGIVPRVSGLAELIRPVAARERFVALPRSPSNPYTSHALPATPDAETLHASSLNLASRVIMRESAYWPDDLGRARADLQPLRIAGTDDPGVAATFMFRDRLAVEPSPAAASYALFVLGSARADGGHDLAWSWYRETAEGGKAAPRYFGQADWDGDGDEEILLEMMGENASWMAALDRRGDAWEMVFEETCPARDASSAGD